MTPVQNIKAERSSMTFICDKKYIVLPASHHAPKKRLLFYIDDKLVYDLVLGLACDDPDCNFSVDIERFSGTTIRLEWDGDADINDINIVLSDIPEFDYSGRYRPLAHYTARRGWLNDPNGLVYYGGKYFMFYQHNPADTVWGNMHWGAAVSDDLMHWEECDGDVLFPDENGTIFSGCGIVDNKNVSGLKKGNDDPILFFYTCAGDTSETSKGKRFVQKLAYSLDGGRTIEMYDKTIIETSVPGNRDPKVIYYDRDDSYIMVLYLDKHDFALYKSKNMIEWREIQRIELPDDAECPDFYPLPLDGNENNIKWVFSAAADRYYIGDFDGMKFVPETKQNRLNYGNTSYAAQSWSDIPNGRRIRTAFASAVLPGMPYGNCMNIPQEMSLKTISGSMRLCAAPVSEIKNLYIDTPETFENFEVNSDNTFEYIVGSKCCDVKLKAKTDDSFTLSLFGMDIVYDANAAILKCLYNEAPVNGENGTVTLRIIYDINYAEIFADDGAVFMGVMYDQEETLNKLRISSARSGIEKLTVSEMRRFYG